MTGHVRRRGERSWELKFDIGTDPLTGKRLTRYHSFKGTKRQLEHAQRPGPLRRHRIGRPWRATMPSENKIFASGLAEAEGEPLLLC
jgi:hypothetical protein